MDNKKEIIFVALELPYPNNSGGRIYTWERIKLLKKLGYKISLFAMAEQGEFINYNELKKYCSNVYIYYRGNKYRNSLAKINIPFSVATRTNRKMQEALKEYEKKNEIEVIIVDSMIMMKNCVNLKSNKILTQHNIEYLAFKSMYENSNNLIKKIIYFREYILMRKFENNVYKKGLVQGYTFISSEDKRIFEKMYPNLRTELIPFGWDCTFSVEKEEIEKNSIVFIGKMDYEPNVQAVKYFVNNIFDKIIEQIPDCKFYVVGKNPTSDIQKFSENERIIVTGTVDSPQEYLEKANLIVIPLISGGGVKIKLFEAIANKKNIITTNKGVEGTAFENGKHLFVESDPIEFANRCVEVLKNFENYTYMKENAYNLLNNFYSWKIIGEKYNEFILDTGKINLKVGE